jgi:hypothetical protein
MVQNLILSVPCDLNLSNGATCQKTGEEVGETQFHSGFLLFLQCWGLNSGPTTQASSPTFLCDEFFFEIGSRELFAQADFEP